MKPHTFEHLTHDRRVAYQSMLAADGKHYCVDCDKTLSLEAFGLSKSGKKQWSCIACTQANLEKRAVRKARKQRRREARKAKA